MKKDPTNIDASDLEILAELKSNPAMWEQVKRLAEVSRDKDPACRLADDAEAAIDKAGQALKLESLRRWARSSNENAEDRMSSQGQGKRSKKKS